MSVSIPTMRVPERILEIHARFGAPAVAPGTSADALVFGRALDDAGSRADLTTDLGADLGNVQPATAPATQNATGSVVDADGTIADDVPYAELFRAAGAAHGIQPSVLAAVAMTESGFDPDAVSPAGAIGLMQFMPATAAGMGVDPTDPASAVDGAARYLAQNLRRFGSLELALAAYNAGPGAVERHGGIPPFPETQAYVPKVLAAAGIDPTTGHRP